MNESEWFLTVRNQDKVLTWDQFLITAYRSHRTPWNSVWRGSNLWANSYALPLSIPRHFAAAHYEAFSRPSLRQMQRFCVEYRIIRRSRNTAILHHAIRRQIAKSLNAQIRGCKLLTIILFEIK